MFINVLSTCQKKKKAVRSLRQHPVWMQWAEQLTEVRRSSSSHTVRKLSWLNPHLWILDRVREAKNIGTLPNCVTFQYAWFVCINCVIQIREIWILGASNCFYIGFIALWVVTATWLSPINWMKNKSWAMCPSVIEVMLKCYALFLNLWLDQRRNISVDSSI